MTEIGLNISWHSSLRIDGHAAFYIWTCFSLNHIILHIFTGCHVKWLSDCILKWLLLIALPLFVQTWLNTVYWLPSQWFVCLGSNIRRGGSMQDRRGHDEWRRDGAGATENVSWGFEKCGNGWIFVTVFTYRVASSGCFATFALQTELNIQWILLERACVTRMTHFPCSFGRDEVYFNDAWISRIKPDVGDNWRLKVRRIWSSWCCTLSVAFSYGARFVFYPLNNYIVSKYRSVRLF